MPKSCAALLLLGVVAAGIAWAPGAFAQNEGQPALVGQYGDWGVYAGTNGGRKVCFALTQPASSETDPPNRPRDPIYLFVSTRPAENVRDEVSIIIGYPLRRGSDVAVEIGEAKFELMTQDDNAWVKNPADEPRLVEAMRKGSEMIVRGVSARGTRTTDKFSLKGISQALDRVAQECR
ncbi:MAG: hypothetical protein IRZ09_10275 [Variibacter sp.]|nr:hypothetical protein [Variibacter sp.]